MHFHSWPLPNMLTFSFPQPPPALPTLPSPLPVTNVDTDLMRTQQVGHEKRQRRGSVGSVDPQGPAKTAGM